MVACDAPPDAGARPGSGVGSGEGSEVGKTACVARWRGGGVAETERETGTGTGGNGAPRGRGQGKVGAAVCATGRAASPNGAQRTGAPAPRAFCSSQLQLGWGGERRMPVPRLACRLCSAEGRVAEGKVAEYGARRGCAAGGRRAGGQAVPSGGMACAGTLVRAGYGPDVCRPPSFARAACSDVDQRGVLAPRVRRARCMILAHVKLQW